MTRSGVSSRPRIPTAYAAPASAPLSASSASLRDCGITLAACGQADIDHWLHAGPSACLARDFLAWAASRGHCQRLTMPAPPRATRSAIKPGLAVDADRPAAERHRARPHQPGRRVPSPALWPAPVSHRRHDHQPGHPRDSGTFIRLGRHDMSVPGPLADAVLQLISGGRSYRGIGSRSRPPGCSPDTCRPFSLSLITLAPLAGPIAGPRPSGDRR